VSGYPNPFGRDCRDPHELYAELRERDPVHRHDGLGAWILTRYDDVSALLRDARFASADPNAAEPGGDDLLGRLRRRTFLFREPPRHDELRSLCRQAFLGRRLSRLRTRIETITWALLEPIEKAGRTELISDLAYALPVRVISEALGLPIDELPSLRAWSDALAVGLVELDRPRGSGEDARESLAELTKLLMEAFDARRRAPRGDLISVLVAAEERGDLDAEELLATTLLLFLAGHETTSNLIGNGIAALAAHPGERTRLQQEPERIGTAVEEFLRFESPVQATRRIALAECEIRGRPIRRGDRVVTVLGAANRDPRVFQEPDRLCIDREPNRHLAFGAGIHFCLGASLARLEAQIAIAAFVRRFPDFELEMEGARWKRSSNLRGLESLPLRV
jgi:pimeloyl-[acyl-carrier protein] synthase